MSGCGLGSSRLVSSLDVPRLVLGGGTGIERGSIATIIYFCWLTHTKSDRAWWWWRKKKRFPFSVAFSQTTEHLVCGGGGPGLETVDISTGCRTHFDFPAKVTSVSTLSNGTVVANVQGFGIQLLSLDQEHASSRQPTPPLLTTYPLDEGRIIAVIPTTDNRIILLETATMLQVFSIPIQEDPHADHPVVLCASLEHRAAVCHLRKSYKDSLFMWKFSHRSPRWTRSMTPPESIDLGSISPAGTRLVTFSRYRRSFVCIWDAHDGKLMTYMSLGDSHVPPPIDITFDSEYRFYSYHNTNRDPYVINAASQTGSHFTHSITRLEKQRLDGHALRKRYCLDDGREWVICGLQRICWVPSGYIGSSHCWAGSSLVMVGQDGTLRKLTFQDSSL